MSVTTKLVECGQTMWNHKKKIVFFSGLSGVGTYYLDKWNNEQRLRTEYARKAEQIGAATIPLPTNFKGDYVPPKLHVFIDKSDKLYHKNLVSFNQNLLPMFELAGLDVNVKTGADTDELKSLSQSEKVKESDAVIIVGSRRDTTDPVLDGIFDESGAETSAKKLLLAVVDPADYKDVEGRCRRALQIIRDVYTSKIQIINTITENNLRRALPDSSLVSIVYSFFKRFLI
ncbi:hypothetical protein M3Y97_01011300 [Aphelenchoides bicaudatus]|nr:hypothetical protein M3Y97_01011300 [Aphelenchoides bicaudatus]